MKSTSYKSGPFFTLLLGLVIFGLTVNGQTTHTLTGNSGKSIEAYGIKQEIMGTWMGRNTWKDIADANWVWAKESGVPAWRTDHFDRPIDVGVPLIPTDGKGDYNSYLKEIISGSQDSTFLSLGKKLAKYGPSLVYARLWWEFNMSPVKQDASLFIAAWRRAVPLIKQGFTIGAVKGQSVNIVWCVNAGTPNPLPFYPGDDVVDVIGSDTYGQIWGDTDPTEEQMLNKIENGLYMLKWQANFANQHKKPTCIGEFGNVASKGNKTNELHGVGDSPQYIDAIYDWIKTCKYGCQYVCYFNLPDGGVGQTLDQTPLALKELKLRAGKPD
ncbi:glycosyl hydrolase [Mucilaginibacter sp. dw_454]|uniref:glycosyl hydrolase n=1 Tax=Mucilaginibacter sp. dw_454 TaxID=2720079 RepID=UPI001BD6BD10|nr:glycosyl hydrolase [Mucilaginibacter sp. dw_454]